MPKGVEVRILSRAQKKAGQVSTSLIVLFSEPSLVEVEILLLLELGFQVLRQGIHLPYLLHVLVPILICLRSRILARHHIHRIEAAIIIESVARHDDVGGPSALPFSSIFLMSSMLPLPVILSPSASWPQNNR